MLHLDPNGLAITRLDSTALAAIAALQSVDNLYVESGAVQVKIFHEHFGQLGGLSTKPRGQYVLVPAISDRTSRERILDIGFHCRWRSNGTPYLYRSRHDDFRSLFAAIEEITGLVI